AGRTAALPARGDPVVPSAAAGGLVPVARPRPRRTRHRNQLQVTSLNAADGQSPQFAATGLPPGLSISGSGLIAGTIAPPPSPSDSPTPTPTPSDPTPTPTDSPSVSPSPSGPVPDSASPAVSPSPTASA